MSVGASGAFAAAAGQPAAELREDVARVEGRVGRLERETARLQGQLAKLEGKLPNQARTFVLGLASGVAVVLLGSVLKWGIDARVARADMRRRERALVAACQAELDQARKSAQVNVQTVGRDLEAVKRRGESVAPLLHVRLPAVARLLETPPRRLTRDEALHTDVMNLVMGAEYANDLSRTRDAYKVLPKPDVVGLSAVLELLDRQLRTVVAAVDAVAPGVAALGSGD